MPSLFQHFAWTWLRPFLVVFCRLKIKGKSNLKGLPDNVILASNHTNEFDPLFIVASLSFFSPLLPIAYVSRSKDFYANLPRGFMYGGKFFELMGAYPVYPGLGDYDKSLQHHIDAINHGRSVGIFPVGRRHTMNEIGKARGGASYLAYTTGLPILPMRIDGVGRDMKWQDYLTFKRRMTITYGKPLYAKDIFGKADKPTHSVCEKAAVRLMREIAKL